jgi:CheY-like chemotaxis protein
MTQQQPAPAKPALKVLVVDDNAASAQTMGWMLELLGHETRLAYNGPEALDIAGKYGPRVVLLDIGLPGMSGYDVCREMKKLPGLEHAMFVAQTGWGQEQHRRMSREAGFDHHLVKPVEMQALQKLLDEACAAAASG